MTLHNSYQEVISWTIENERAENDEGVANK